MERVVASANIFRFGLFEADAARNLLTRAGMRVKIQDQPFRVLVLLLERPGEIVTREELRKKLWAEGTYVDFDGSLNVILKKLRAAIDDDSDNPRFVETVPRRGYRFIAPVSAIAPEPPTVRNGFPAMVERKPAVSASPVEPSDSISAQERAPVQRKPLHPYLYLSAFGASLVILGAAWLLWHGKRERPAVTSRSGSAPTVHVRKSVAILGFQNVSGRADESWLGTALSEMLSTELAGGDALRLVSGEDVANLRQSSPWSQTYTLDQKTTSRIGKALNSDLLVLGSFTLIGEADRGRLRLDIRMQDAKTGEILTEIAEVGSAQDLFPMVGHAGDRLRDRLDIPTLDRSDQAAVVASLPLDRDAARFYARGLAKMREFDALAAKDLFQQAIKTDPKFAMVHLMLARAWAQLGYEQKRKEEAKKARDLSLNLPAAARLEVEGEYYESLADHEKAASTFGALFQMFPDSVEYGLLLASAQNAAGHASQAAYTIAQLRALPAPASDDPRIDLADVGARNDPARLALIRSAMRKASAQGKKMIYAQARKAECLNLIYSEHPEEGPPACQDAYNIYIEAGNRLGAADAIRLLGDYEGAQGHLDQAIATYQRALTILEELGEHYKTGAVLNNMAIDFTNAGKLDRGEQLYRQAKSHFEQAGDKANVALTIANIADIYFLRGDLPGAASSYHQALEIQSTLDHGDTSYLLMRLSDLELTQGHIPDAHRLAQQAIDEYRPNKGAYGYLAEAMIQLGEVLRDEGNLDGARQQFESARDLAQKLGSGLFQESQAELAGLALEEGHADQAESLLHPAIARFEQEKSDPSASAAYTDLSRALLMEGRTEEAHKAVERAIQLSMTSSDPALKLPAAIQNARVEMASAGQEGNSNPAAVRMQLKAVIGTTRKLGYYELECEARLALGALEAKVNPASARIQLTALVSETRSRGLELLARQAERAVALTGTSISAANQPIR